MSSVPRPHVALFPAAGMGHLMPFLHLAALLSRHGCVITLITAQPTTSVAEASHIRSFLSAHPEAHHLVLELIPIPQGLDVANADPFFLQTERMNRSVPQLHPFLKELSPPLSAVFSDLFLVAAVAEVAEELGLPMYIPYTSSARFYALFLHLPELTSSPDFLRSGESEITVPGVPSFPVSSIPPAFADNSNLFTMTLVRNSKAVSKARGVIMNNFEWFESLTLAALNSGQVLESLPPSIPVGPFEPYSLGKGSAEYLPWLNSQLVGSVVYLSFGSRTAISKQQIRELANALKRGVTKFLWSVKTSKVDKDDKEDLKNVLGDGFLEETAGKGFTLKKWVDQGEILAHPAVGGFVSHCGWNSVMEAAREGVPILAWPLHGDQRVNAELVMDTGLGIWDVGWGIGNQTLVQAEEIETKISKLMKDEKLKETARRVKEEAANAVVSGGSSNQMIRDLLKCLVHSSESRKVV